MIFQRIFLEVGEGRSKGGRVGNDGAHGPCATARMGKKERRRQWRTQDFYPGCAYTANKASAVQPIQLLALSSSLSPSRARCHRPSGDPSCSPATTSRMTPGRCPHAKALLRIREQPTLANAQHSNMHAMHTSFAGLCGWNELLVLVLRSTKHPSSD